MKNIFKCTKCKGQKVRTRTHGMVCMNCKPPRTGRVEKKGDREKLEKELKRIREAEANSLDKSFQERMKKITATYIPINPTSQRKVVKTVKVSPICLVDIDEEGYPIGVEILS